MTVRLSSPAHANAPIVALHSSASSGAQWSSLGEDLHGRFDVMAPDLPGYGAPSLDDAGSAGTQPIAERIVRQVETFGVPVHLVGHSFGATVALKIALMRPDLIKSLTLYEPAAFHFLQWGGEEELRLGTTIKAVRDALAAHVAEGAPEAGMRAFIDFWNGAGAFDSFGSKTQERFAAMAGSILDDFACGFSESWTLEDLSALKMPTLMMMGMESPAIAQHVAIEIAGAIRDARLAMLPGLGHMAPVFEPGWVNPRIFEHIAGTERPVANCYWPERSAA
ncbi:alpha/beta fold hydrolase [Hoeflea prorocentri]|uniref:Alpha/beta hydrolase n=1 Tax=Hoeflea prorocentri TaxID=1922333 RepID=A0A9X3ZJK9_9HYPH|nr:alpha/beta hydrolase [Hoeflea prorocentri]MCY6383579.1 alpha/beta hydrolase [Hoeflea prorocentri]MDA5401379.1 alpha/beta hydrolase [Hoeflea prorocentri]